MKRARPTRRDLLLVLGTVQGLVGRAIGAHANDRDPDGYERGQKALEEAERLCTEARGFDPPLDGKKSRNGWGEEPSKAVPIRLTTKQRAILERLATGRRDFVEVPYSEHVTKGKPSRFEKTLALLADRGLVDWSGPISDVGITPAGRMALARNGASP